MQVCTSVSENRKTRCERVIQSYTSRLESEFGLSETSKLRGHILPVAALSLPLVVGSV